MFKVPSNRQEVVLRMQQDFKDKIKDSNPWHARGVIFAVLWALGGRLFDFYLQLKSIADSAFLQTADIEDSEKFAYLKNLPRLKGSKAHGGKVAIKGVPKTSVPLGIELQLDGAIYTTERSGFVDSDGFFYTSVYADSIGADKNLQAGKLLNFLMPLPGLEPQVEVITPISGGADAESLADHKERLREAYSNVYGNFSEVSIRTLAKSVAGVTRVWVKRCTPAPGHCSVYFVCDKNTNIIPQEIDIQNVKELLSQYAPCDMLLENVHVLCPHVKEVNIKISALQPDIPSLREAITANLEDFFRTQNDLGACVTLARINALIFNSFDNNTGLKPTSFILLDATDISVSDTEIAILNGVTYD